VDEALQILTAFHAGILILGLLGLWAGRRWPRAVSVVIGLVIVGGFGLIWYGAYAAQDDYHTGKHWFQAGLGMVFYGLPACVLVAKARHRTGTTIGPVGFRGWVEGVGTYLIACWFTAFLLGGIAALGMAPSGSAR
jgi:hypothetical protein